MDKYLDKFDELLSLITDDIEIDGKKVNLKDEFEKYYIKENKSAATRIRKIMQLIKFKSQEIREDVQEFKKGLK